MSRYAQSSAKPLQVQAGHNGTGSTISFGYGVALNTNTSYTMTSTRAPYVTLTTGAFDFWGVAMEDIADGYDGRVMTAGVAVAVAGGTITLATTTYVKSNSSGTFQAATADTDVICGKALNGAVSGDYFPMQIMHSPIGGATT